MTCLHYRGRDIFFVGLSYYVGEASFTTLAAAREAIDELPLPHPYNHRP